MKDTTEMFIQTPDERLYLLEIEYITVDEQNFILNSTLHQFVGYDEYLGKDVRPQNVFQEVSEIKEHLSLQFGEKDVQELLLLFKIYHLDLNP